MTNKGYLSILGMSKDEKKRGGRSATGFLVLAAAWSILAQYDPAIDTLRKLLQPFSERVGPFVVGVLVLLLLWPAWRFGVWIWEFTGPKPVREVAREPTRAVASNNTRPNKRKLLDDAAWLYDWCQSTPLTSELDDERAKLIRDDLIDVGLLNRLSTVNATPWELKSKLAEVIAQLERFSLDEAVANLRRS